MDWKLVCQWLLLAGAALRFLAIVNVDFNGTKAKPPNGFEGFVGTMISCGTAFVIAYVAGAYSLIFGQ